MSTKDETGSEDPEGKAGGEQLRPIRSIHPKGSKALVAASTALVDPRAREKVEAAAQAAGFTDATQLIDFIVDSGLTALPPSDGIVREFSLEDLGKHLWNTMQQHTIAGRAKWFHGLAPTQQVAIIVVLRSRGFASLNIAREFEVEEFVIQRAWNKYADDLGAQVVGVRLTHIAGELRNRAEQVMEMLMTNGKPDAAFRVQKDYIKLLQDLGIVDRAIRRVEVTHKMDEEQKRELERLMELERKQKARREEIKQIEAEVYDPVPEG